MKIVVEYVLIENMLINLIVFKTTAAILKEKGRFFLLSAFLGGCMSVAIPAIGLTKIGNFLLLLGVNTLLICLSFRFKKLKNFLKIFVCYYLSAFLYGGACYMFFGIVGQTALICVLAVVVVLFGLLHFVMKEVAKKRKVENFCHTVELEMNGKTISVKGFLDSGNLLFDPVTNMPVSLINFKTFEKLCKNVTLEDVLHRDEKVLNLKAAHYINIGTLGAGDKILVFQVDNISVEGSKVENPVLGLSFKDFKALGSDMILHNNFAVP